MAKESDRMPGGWKIATALLGFVVLIGLGYVAWLQSQVDKNATAIQLVQGAVAAENEKRAESQRKTDVTVTEIKGKLESLEKNVERVEKGQEKIKEQLEKNTTQQEKLNSNLEQILRQRGRMP